MRHSKFFRFYISITLILILFAGCTATATPTVVMMPSANVLANATSTAEIGAEHGAAGMGDSLYPNFGNGGYDVQHYTLDLTVHDVARSDLDGDVTIDARATQSLSTFNLDFIGFGITNITVNGLPAQHRRSGQELIVTPSTPLTENESFTVEVQYRGTPTQMTSAALAFQTGWAKFDGGSFVLSEPDGAATFYPVNDHPLDKATYTFRITVPQPFEVATNGVLTDTIENGEMTTFVFETRDPMASYLATVNIGEFDLETSQAENGVPIRNYYPAGREEDLRGLFKSQEEMIPYFSELFGTYPFEVYGALVVNKDLGVALENQTMSVFGMRMIDPDYVEGSQQVIAHELAHQWFGDSVSVADWRDIWLNESFATYAQGLWIEHTSGREALDDWIRQLYRFVLQNRDSMSPPGEPAADDLFNGGVYDWGALGLHALRLEVGDEAFFQILKTYHDRYKGSNARTSDFIAVAEEVSGRALGAFFDSWLYSQNLASIPALGLEPK
jgi:aminopeptidase N